MLVSRSFSIAFLGLHFFARHCWSQPQQIPEPIDLAIAQRNYSRAETLLVEAARTRPGSTELLLKLGRVFFLNEKYLNCATALERAAKLNQLAKEDRITLAISYVQLGQFHLANEELQELLAADPGYSSAHYWLGRMDYESQRFASAQARFETVIELEPRNARAYDYRALCLQALGRYEGATNAFHDAIRVNRLNAAPSAWPPFDFASLLMLKDQLNDAAPYLLESLKYDPRFPQAHHRLEVILAKQSDVSRAIEELERAAALDQSYPEPLHALAGLYRQQGKVEQANKALAAFETRRKQSFRSSHREN